MSWLVVDICDRVEKNARKDFVVGTRRRQESTCVSRTAIANSDVYPAHGLSKSEVKIPRRLSLDTDTKDD
jgi:hypothetical protein